MAKFKTFEDIEAWQEARKLTKAIYKIGERGRHAKDWALADQLQRASVSIMSNIVEGFDSDSTAEFLRFLSYSRRSASEVQSHLYIVKDQEYISETEFSKVYEQSEKVRRMVTALMNYLKQYVALNAPTHQRTNAIKATPSINLPSTSPSWCRHVRALAGWRKSRWLT